LFLLDLKCVQYGGSGLERKLVRVAQSKRFSYIHVLWYTDVFI
jgi:hypothetical protein